MPRIFDNIGEKLLPALQTTLDVSDRADFCVGYFNLRGWRQLDSRIEQWSGEDGQCCRLLVGMQTLPHDELRHSLSFVSEGLGLDNQAVVRLKKKLAEEFRDQIAMGVPTNEDEAGLRQSRYPSIYSTIPFLVAHSQRPGSQAVNSLPP